MTGGSYWYSMHCAVAHSASRVTQRMTGWRDSALPAEWMAAVTVTYSMSDSTLSHSSISYDIKTADQVSLTLCSIISLTSTTHTFISHVHVISLLLYQLFFIPDPSTISPIITYHHWHLIY